MMLTKMCFGIPLSDIVFVDIETVPIYPSFDDADFRTQMLWERKNIPYDDASLLAEYGKIVCIGVGGYKYDESSKTIKRVVGCITGDEAKLLTEFAEYLNKHDRKVLCAHNGYEFDYPFMIRRMIVNGVKVPTTLNFHGKKPWEIKHLDTMNIWKFGQYRHFASLDSIANALGIESPKDDISGKDVAKVYWVDKDLSRIETYCKKDVKTLMEVFSRMSQT